LAERFKLEDFNRVSALFSNRRCCRVHYFLRQVDLKSATLTRPDIFLLTVKI